MDGNDDQSKQLLCCIDRAGAINLILDPDTLSAAHSPAGHIFMATSGYYYFIYLFPEFMMQP